MEVWNFFSQQSLAVLLSQFAPAVTQRKASEHQRLFCFLTAAMCCHSRAFKTNCPMGHKILKILLKTRCIKVSLSIAKDANKVTENRAIRWQNFANVPFHLSASFGSVISSVRGSNLNFELTFKFTFLCQVMT